MTRCGRCGRAGIPKLGIRGGLCGACREQHGPWIQRSVAEFYATLARAEGVGPVPFRLEECQAALEQLDKLEAYQKRGITTTREPAEDLRARIQRCRTELDLRHRRAERQEDAPQEQAPEPRPASEQRPDAGTAVPARRTAAVVASAGRILTPARIAALERAGTVLAVCLAAAYFASGVWNLRGCAIDPAYASFRYSNNLAWGVGPVYNTTGPPAEGYTSPLWMVLLAVPHRLGLSAPAFAWWVSVLATLGYAALAAAIARRAILEMHPPAAPLCVLVPALLAAQGLAAIHATSGMETALFTLLVVVFQWCSMGALDEYGDRWRPAVCVGLSAGALGLMRPEGNVLVLLGGAFLLALSSRSGRLRVALALTVGWLLPVFGYQAWRIWYYGLPAPLPFYVSVLGVPPLSGLTFTWGFVLANLLALAVPFGVGVVWADQRLTPSLAGAAGLLVLAVWPEHTSGDSYRFLFPIEPLILVISAAGCARLCSIGASRARRAAAFMAACLVVAVAMVRFATSALPALAEAQAEGAALQDTHVQLGVRLQSLRLPGSTMLAMGDPGVVPYLSGWTTTDTSGLNEPHIAVTGDRSPAYVLRQRPDVLVLVSSSSSRFVPRRPWEGPLYRAVIARGWQPVDRLASEPDHCLWVLARRGSPAWRKLTAPRRAGTRRPPAADGTPTASGRTMARSKEATDGR